MTYNSASSEQVLFKTLPKEQQKELRNEFRKTEKKGKRIIALIVILCTITVTLIVVSLFIHKELYYSTTPLPIFFIAPIAAMYDERFAKWLKDEKGIEYNTRRRRKEVKK